MYLDILFLLYLKDRLERKKQPKHKFSKRTEPVLHKKVKDLPTMVQLPPKMPLFITGHPRSGTTLLRLIFNSHSQLTIPDETGLLHWFYKRPWYKKFTRSKMPIPSAKSKAFGEDIIALFNQQSRSLRNNPKKAIEFLYNNLAKKEGKKYWGDKTPLHTQFTDEIIALFPNAFIINLIRDPRAVISSAKRNVKNKREGTDFWISNDLDKTIERWRWEYGLIKQYCQKYPNNTAKLVYEEFVAQPEQQLMALCQRIGLAFEPEMLNYHEERKKDAAQMTAWHKETAKPVNEGNIDKWRKELTEEEITKINNLLAEEMAEIGYL